MHIVQPPADAYRQAIARHDRLISRIAWYVAACAKHGFSDRDVAYLTTQGADLNASLDALGALVPDKEA